ncbi:hypothetical protein PsorP6_005206 [Peronosclerospora sorghi]|uniref:Uncharacterized protein n=1 Tax=Peronosclerospora sorghi TaxID=230839 RepID=A0ACC0W3M4_9STRA|nr:hypothetical protein PsorP6_005206 [Peronosclerospora sorghi]
MLSRLTMVISSTARPPSAKKLYSNPTGLSVSAKAVCRCRTPRVLLAASLEVVPKTCGNIANATEQSQILAAEQEWIENGFPESLEAIDGVVRRGVLHERHYLLFWALDSTGCEAAHTAAYENEAPHRRALATIWERTIRYMNETIYYDNLAQVYVVLGDLAAASEAYARAYEISCLVSGTDCLPTRKLQKLMEMPPQTAQELRKLHADEARQRLRPQSAADDDDMRNE